jgi:hypothetical protein
VKDEAFDAIRPETGICATASTFYAALYPELREAARQVGYALTLHGSLVRDLDVVAIPWVPEAVSADDLVVALLEACGGFTVGQRGFPKPWRRRCWTISLGGSGGFVDLSVMPRDGDPVANLEAP